MTRRFLWLHPHLLINVNLRLNHSYPSGPSTCRRIYIYNYTKHLIPPTNSAVSNRSQRQPRLHTHPVSSETRNAEYRIYIPDARSTRDLHPPQVKHYGISLLQPTRGKRFLLLHRSVEVASTTTSLHSRDESVVLIYKTRRVGEPALASFINAEPTTGKETAYGMRFFSSSLAGVPQVIG